MFANHLYSGGLISRTYNAIKDSQNSISNQLKLGKILNWNLRGCIDDKHMILSKVHTCQN